MLWRYQAITSLLAASFDQKAVSSAAVKSLAPVALKAISSPNATKVIDPHASQRFHTAHMHPHAHQRPSSPASRMGMQKHRRLANHSTAANSTLLSLRTDPKALFPSSRL
jgi:hypothetical protein